MLYNDYRVKTSAELSEYQKRIENIENVILCVSETERMIESIGLDLMSEDHESDTDSESKPKLKFVPIRAAQQEPVRQPLIPRPRQGHRRKKSSGKDYGF